MFKVKWLIKWHLIHSELNTVLKSQRNISASEYRKKKGPHPEATEKGVLPSKDPEAFCYVQEVVRLITCNFIRCHMQKNNML